MLGLESVAAGVDEELPLEDESDEPLVLAAGLELLVAARESVR